MIFVGQATHHNHDDNSCSQKSLASLDAEPDFATMDGCNMCCAPKVTKYCTLPGVTILHIPSELAEIWAMEWHHIIPQFGSAVSPKKECADWDHQDLQFKKINYAQQETLRSTPCIVHARISLSQHQPNTRRANKIYEYVSCCLFNEHHEALPVKREYEQNN